MKKRVLIAMAIAFAVWCVASEPQSASAFTIGPAPTVAAPPVVLSQAQARWFINREVHKFARHRRRESCWRLSPATVACSMETKSWLPGNPWRRTTELAERQCCEYIRIWLAGQVPLTAKEVEAL